MKTAVGFFATKDEATQVRHPLLDQGLAPHDFTASGMVELTAMREEAVVGKTSRVVEEVVVSKVGSDKAEQIFETVRHTEVDVAETSAEKY